MVETSSRSLHLFISHEEKEKKIAISLKRLIKHIFRGRIDVFVSSDDESIPSGKQWFDVLTTALRQADYVVILCSDTAVKRPWINFELGGACLLKKDIIPLCIHDMQFSQLPPPYSNFQGFAASNYTRLSKLFRDMADRISYHLPLYDIESTEYHRAIHNLSFEKGFVSLALEGTGCYYVREKIRFTGTATGESEIVKLKIYYAEDPYSPLEELKVAIQNDQTYVQEIDSSRYPPGQYFVLAETQTGMYARVTFLLRDMKTNQHPDTKNF